MVSVTLSIPEDIKHKMEHFSEINWSGLIRKVIIEKASELEWKERMRTQLNKEKDINKWALDLENKGRKDRLIKLKKKGLL